LCAVLVEEHVDVFRTVDLAEARQIGPIQPSEFDYGLHLPTLAHEPWVFTRWCWVAGWLTEHRGSFRRVRYPSKTAGSVDRLSHAIFTRRAPRPWSPLPLFESSARAAVPYSQPTISARPTTPVSYATREFGAS
jgi:hypothetical protein